MSETLRSDASEEGSKVEDIVKVQLGPHVGFK
jgi:hypothetical protein